MLSLVAKKLLINSIPSSITIDGHAFLVNSTLGSIPLNELSLPTINVKFIGEGTPSYRSIDNECIIDDITTSYKDTRSCTIRFTIGAKDTIINTSESIKYVTGTNIYDMQRVPVQDIVSIGTYRKNIDYKLSSSHDSIEWIGTKPSNNTNFTVNYNWIDSGFYIADQLTDYLMKDVHGRIFDILKPYGINIIDSKGVVDISQIYASDVLNAFCFDMVITYPFTWSTTITSEDAVTANTISLDLTVNDIDAGTISYTKPED